MQQAGRIYQPQRRVEAPVPVSRPVARPAQRAATVKLILVLLTSFLLGLALVAQYSSIVVLNYKLGSARSELSTMRENTRVLELEAARLASVGRVEQIAREDLEMIEPVADQMILFRSAR